MTPYVDQSKARWIRTSVEMLDHPVFDGAEYCPRSAWLWLIANAAWKQRRFKPAKSNVVLTLERGQVPVGREYLAKIWGWSEKKVRNFLALLQSENMIEMGQSKGRYANIATICNYEKYQSKYDEKGQLEGQLEDGLGAGSGPVEGHTLTKNTNTTKITNNSFSARERVTPAPQPEPPRPVENKKTTGREFWTQAMRVEPEPEHRTVTCENGKLILHNGYRAEWLGRFDGDANRLDLALLQAMNFVQPNSGKPLEAQVSAQLARQVAEKCDRDARYAAASKPAKPDRSNMVFKPSRYGPGKWVPKEAVAS